jgi:hypothetical protein
MKLSPFMVVAVHYCALNLLTKDDGTKHFGFHIQKGQSNAKSIDIKQEKAYLRMQQN